MFKWAVDARCIVISHVVSIGSATENGTLHSRDEKHEKHVVGQPCLALGFPLHATPKGVGFPLHFLATAQYV